MVQAHLAGGRRYKLRKRGMVALYCRDVVSVLNVSVSRRSRDVFWNVSSRLVLEDITSRSRDFSLVNIHAMHQACGCIAKKITDLTRKEQTVKWQTSPVGVLNCDSAVSIRFLERLGLESLKNWNVSVLWLNVLWTSLPTTISSSLSTLQ